MEMIAGARGGRLRVREPDHRAAGGQGLRESGRSLPGDETGLRRPADDITDVVLDADQLAGEIDAWGWGAATAATTRTTCRRADWRRSVTRPRDAVAGRLTTGWRESMKNDGCDDL